VILGHFLWQRQRPKSRLFDENFESIHMPNSSLLLISLLLLTICPGLPVARPVHAQELPSISARLASESEAERCQAIIELSENTSEDSSRLLLKHLKRNLSTRRGYYVKYDTVITSFGTLWTSTRSENELLVAELGKRKYLPALPIFQKMLKLNEKWVGVSRELTAANIYLFLGRPVAYTVNGDARVYPAPDTYSELMPSFLLPAPGELAWTNDSPNDRFRDIVSILGQASGPLDDHPLYKSLKTEIGYAELVKRVNGNDPLVRPYAVEALGILGEHRSETLALLLTTIGDADPRVRVRSVRALSRMLPAGTGEAEYAPIIPALIRALHDPEAQVRYYSIAPLARYIHTEQADAHKAREIVALLVSALNDRMQAVRAEAAETLGWVGPLTAEVVPSLLRLLESPKADDREAAVKGVGQLLQNSMFKQMPDRRRLEDQIWQALGHTVRDGASSVRYELAKILGWTAPATQRAIPLLIKLTRDPSSGVRTASARALGEFEVDRSRITSALAAMLNVPEEEDEVIRFTLSALSELGPDARAAAPEVRKLLRSNRPELHNSALDTLEKIGAPQKP
jgi:HEAT repeat protein